MGNVTKNLINMMLGFDSKSSIEEHRCGCGGNGCGCRSNKDEHGNCECGKNECNCK